MKNKYFFIGALLALSVFSGCSEDFLDRPPQSALVDANFYQTDAQILASTSLLYNIVWFDYNDKASYNLGDYRGGTVYSQWNDRDNVEFNTTANTPDNGATWRSFFNVIGQANTTIYNINTYAGSAVSESVKQHAIAEARFMRATAYSLLVMNYGAVPIIENNLNYLENSTSLVPNTVESVWEFITRDYLFAAENLPATPVQLGRVTKWSAEGMLARTYLTRAGVGSTGGNKNQEFLDKAKQYAEDVIINSGKALLPRYEDLFKYPYDNNNESLFELQWVFHPTAWGTQNSAPAYLAFSGDIANGDGWGGDKGATLWMLSQYDGLVEDGFTVDQRLKATFMLPGFIYPEITQNATDAAGKAIKQDLLVPFTGTDNNVANVKKYVPGQAVDMNGEAMSQRYPIDTYMLRLAEMYLIYAEAAVANNNVTTDSKALEYFNMVHTRAGLPPVTTIRMDRVFTADSTLVNGDKIPVFHDDIFEERVKEFAMEGMVWYDLVRMHYYNPEKAYGIISNQDRGHYFVQPNQMPNPTSWTFIKTSWATARFFKANSGNFMIPIPAAELSQAPNLMAEPVPYDFGD